MLTSPAMWMAARDQKSSAGSAASREDIVKAPGFRSGGRRLHAGCSSGRMMGFQLILEPSRGSASCCDPAARCELHAKTCEASTLQIAQCEATSKVLEIPILRQTETRSAARLSCHLHRRARKSYNESACQLLQKAFQMNAADRVLQLADGFGLDLSHALARDLEDAANLFQRVGVAVLQAIAKTDDLALAPREGLEQAFDLLPQDALVGAVHRVVAGVVLDELAK